MTTYSFRKRLSEDLVGLDSREYGPQLWDRSKARKASDCKVTGRRIEKGQPSWRPVTNGYNRAHRVSDAGVLELEASQQRGQVCRDQS